MISIIVAQSTNRVIGKENDLPWYLPNDLQHFKLVTSGHPIVMGRKSFEHILERTRGKLLPGRTNIVVTRDTGYSYPGAIITYSLDEAIEKADSKEVFIIGGGQLYEQALEKADRIYLTQVHTTVEGDTFFPEIRTDEWHEVSREQHFKDDSHAFAYDFILLERK